jgi:hypothetical protein
MQRGHGPCRHKSPGTECKVGERQDETQRPRGHISGALLFLVARPRARRLCEGHYPLRPLAHVAACVPLGVAPCATLSRARRTLAQPGEGAPVPLACAAVPGTACLRCAIRQEERTTKHTSSGPCRTPYQSTRRRDYVVRLQNDAPSGPVLLRGAVTYDEPGGQALGRSSGADLYAARALRRGALWDPPGSGFAHALGRHALCLRAIGAAGTMVELGWIAWCRILNACRRSCEWRSVCVVAGVPAALPVLLSEEGDTRDSDRIHVPLPRQGP